MGQTETKFNLIEVKANNTDKDFFVEGFISTTDPDLYNDIVTEEAQKHILRQLLNRNITMDEEHDIWVDPVTGRPHDRPQNKIPAARIVDAQLRDLGDGVVGTWVRVELNKDYPNFEKLLGSIKKGFMDSFSIAYNVINSVAKKVGDKVFRIIDNLHIFNVGITGSPVNSNAQFELALKSINKMAENNNQEEEMKTQIKNLSDENAQLKARDEKRDKEFEELKNKYSSSKAHEAETKSLVESKDTEMAELKSQFSVLAELKSKVESFEEVKADVAELKAVVEKVRSTPIAGAQLKAQEVKETRAGPQDISFATMQMGGHQ